MKERPARYVLSDQVSGKEDHPLATALPLSQASSRAVIHSRADRTLLDWIRLLPAAYAAAANPAHDLRLQALVSRVYAFLCADTSCSWWLMREGVNERDIYAAAIKAARYLKTLAGNDSLQGEDEARHRCRLVARRKFFDVDKRQRSRTVLRLQLPRKTSIQPSVGMRECLVWALARIGTDMQIRAAILHYVFEYTYVEIARFEDRTITADAARKRAAAGLRKLRARFVQSDVRDGLRTS